MCFKFRKISSQDQCTQLFPHNYAVGTVPGRNAVQDSSLTWRVRASHYTVPCMHPTRRSWCMQAVNDSLCLAASPRAEIVSRLNDARTRDTASVPCRTRSQRLAIDGLHVRGSGSDGSARRQSQARTRLDGWQTRRTVALGWWCGARAPSGSGTATIRGTGSPRRSGLDSCRGAVRGARVCWRVSRQNQLTQHRLPMRLATV